MKINMTSERSPVEITDSYYSYLKYLGCPSKGNYEMGYHFDKYSDDELSIFIELMDLKLTPYSIKQLIKSYNSRMNELSPYENPNIRYTERSKIRYDIRNHFIVTKILYDMEKQVFNDNYTIYKKIDQYENIMFIGINGIPNEELSIPQNVDKIINNGVFEKTKHFKPQYPILNPPKIGIKTTPEGIDELNREIKERIAYKDNNEFNPELFSLLYKKVR